MNQPELFDTSRTVSTACPVPGCGAIRLPGQDRVVTCDVDLARATAWVTRPPNCLNMPKPQHTGIPY